MDAISIRKQDAINHSLFAVLDCPKHQLKKLSVDGDDFKKLCEASHKTLKKTLKYVSGLSEKAVSQYNENKVHFHQILNDLKDLVQRIDNTKDKDFTPKWDPLRECGGPTLDDPLHGIL